SSPRPTPRSARPPSHGHAPCAASATDDATSVQRDLDYGADHPTTSSAPHRSERNAMTVYARPGTEGAKVSFEPRYENYIGGQWVPPVKGEYFENPSPVTGEVFTEVARSTAEDVELALDAAHAAAPGWGTTSVAERAVILNRIADRIEENLELLAVAETWDNGKPIRECLNADLPLAADHF